MTKTQEETETKTNSNADYPAYPSGDFRSVQPVYGLTKREFFAALAMQGFNANPAFVDKDHDDIARWSIDQADALLTALSEDKR